MLCTLDAVLLALLCAVFASFASPASIAESTFDNWVGDVMILALREYGKLWLQQSLNGDLITRSKIWPCGDSSVRVRLKQARYLRRGVQVRRDRLKKAGIQSRVTLMHARIVKPVEVAWACLPISTLLCTVLCICGENKT